MPNSRQYVYDANIINNLEKSISVPRLSTYVRESVEGTPEAALKLHLWNARISSELHFPLQIAEITLRNALHGQLSVRYGDEWPLQAQAPLNRGAQTKINDAIEEIRRHNKPVTANRVVANLSFGFWTSLLGRGGQGHDYAADLWTPTLSKAFRRKNRRDVQNRYFTLKKLRNRIAHHEPIFQQDLSKANREALESISWHCNETKNWVEHHSGVIACLAEKPQTK